MTRSAPRPPKSYNGPADKSACEQTVEDPWRVEVQDYLPAAGLVLAMSLAWVTHRRPGEMAGWGISAAALARGDYETIPLHIFAHGGLLHLTMNSVGLLEVGGLVTARLGGFPKGWVRLFVAFFLAGLSSMILFLSFHPAGHTPLIGASGAIYGLLGLLLGVRLTEDLERVAWRKMPRALWCFGRDNVAFLALIAIGAGLGSLSARIAWEAHLGGFLCGLSAAPWLVPLDERPRHSTLNRCAAGIEN